MKRALFILHSTIASIVVVLCLYQLWRSYNLYEQEPLSVTYQRASVAFLLGTYAGAQLLFQFRKKLEVTTAIAFYPLGILLILVTGSVTRMSSKSWAPATSEEAFLANILGYSALVFVIVVCVASFTVKNRSKN